jgi:type 1 fimbriae regulatory protein FimB/type 1 fimbriae regulatory protein FimE
MSKPQLRLVVPTAVNRTVPPRRPPNAELRAREHLTESEINKLLKAAGDNRYGHRDRTMILIAFRHGLRAAELVGLRWDSIDLSAARMHVNRAKGGGPSTHPLAGVELRALRKLQRESDASPFVFQTERGSPFSTAGFHKLVARLGKAAGIGFGVHPHMLRHACGYKLANQGVDTRSLQAYLGHKSIGSTVRYTALSDNRFKGFWKD